MKFSSISEVAEVNPRAPKSLANAPNTKVSFVPMAAVSEEGFLNAVEERTAREVLKGYTYFERGDVLIAKITPCMENGKAVHLNSLPLEVGFGSTEFHVLRPGSEIDGLYLFHMVWNKSFRYAAAQNMTGTAGQKRVPTDFFDRIQIPLPPLSEQKRIAAILDKADAIRKKRKKAIELTETFLRSAFLEMFGDPVTNPMGWEVQPLEKIAKVNRGKFSVRPRNDPRYYGGLFPFIQTGDLSGCTGVLRQWKQTLNEMGTTVSRKFPAGTIAIAIAANIGDTAILGFDSYFPDSVVGIEVNKNKTRSEYIEYVLRFHQQMLQHHAPETAQKNINLQTLRPLVTPVPPLTDQGRFEKICNMVWGLQKSIEGQEGNAEDLFNSLVQRAFGGEL